MTGFPQRLLDPGTSMNMFDVFKHHIVQGEMFSINSFVQVTVLYILCADWLKPKKLVYLNLDHLFILLIYFPLQNYILIMCLGWQLILSLKSTPHGCWAGYHLAILLIVLSFACFSPTLSKSWGHFVPTGLRS